ncbi:MAG: aminotransferase class V-fold PLP-dependent enzyme [Acidobacteriales bacterium]|nr:aminotransferase class V-fold PLP-dependent enzyme [Terriglobales bacterium]
MHLETLAVHSGEMPSIHENEPITTPIILGTNFERHADGEYKHGWSYTRAANPNRTSWEGALAALEGGKAAAAFSSGSAATMALFQALQPGDHVIATAGFYGTTKILKELLAPWGLNVTLLDTGKLDAVRAALTPQTKLVFVETPSNPLMRVSDIAALAEIAHKHGARMACDSTAATPVLQRSLALGADLALHSATKYLGGHSDVAGGALIADQDDEFFAKVRAWQTTGGAIQSPFDCWLLQRGAKTLALRVRQQAANAQTIAEFLAGHKNVQSCLYAGLKSHPGHDIAARQMQGGFGGLLSFLVHGGQKEALGVTAKCKLIRRATSLGGVETTIDHRGSVEPPGFGTPENLLRLSVGIEHVDDLIADLDQALQR